MQRHGIRRECDCGRLRAIATGNLSETISNLIEWAEAEGKLEQLLIAARKENPGNPVLRKFDEQIRNS